MNTAPKEDIADKLERAPEEPRKARNSAIPTDVKRTLNLRHQTALAWVMPETWEPLHN